MPDPKKKEEINRNYDPRVIPSHGDKFYSHLEEIAPEDCAKVMESFRHRGA